MGDREPIVYDVDPHFEVIEWQGEKGEVSGLGRIAFPPKSSKQKTFHGKKVSFVFRGKGYRSPYTGDEWRKGYVIALPIEVFNDVEITAQAYEVKLQSDLKHVLVAIQAIYKKPFRGKIIKTEIIHSRVIPLNDLLDKPFRDVLANTFPWIPKENINPEVILWLSGKKKMEGYVEKKYSLKLQDGKVIMEVESKEKLSVAPLDVLLERFDTLKVKVIVHFTNEDYMINKYESSHLHKCIEKYVFIRPEEPIYSFKIFKLPLKEFHDLVNAGKLQINKTKFVLVHDIVNGEYQSGFYYEKNGEFVYHTGIFTMEEALEYLRDYDMSKLKKQLDATKERLKEITEYYMHYYVNMSKEQIIQKFHEIWKETGGLIVQSVDKRAWIKIVNREVDGDINYGYYTYDISIIVPEKGIEIKGHYYEGGDEYTDYDSEAEYKEVPTDITIEYLTDQEKQRNQEIEDLTKEIEELTQKIEEMKQKKPEEIYSNIVEFFSKGGDNR